MKCRGKIVIERYKDSYTKAAYGKIYGYDERDMDEDCICLELNIDVPEALFEPYKVNIVVPPEFIQEDHIKTEIKSIEVPVIPNKIDERVVETIFEEEPSRTGILGVVKKWFEKKNS